ncbi:Deoxyribonuclease-2-alpha [Trichinella papuae]|uniref:Deoxyribonuclease-2-alpha n=1 Tax=Trichinella papuae TaxID=268474 RepID=A0A0V1M567_9BILA|nr:Deoxyribonuclease-2-alpha [Trichinella papuae]
MLTVAIAILISFGSSWAQNVATCKADNDADLNWYFVYKPPNVLQTKIMQSQGRPAWGPSAQTIERDNGHSVVRTMVHFIGNNANIKVLAYSDDPPNLPPRNEKSKAKGVLLIDNTGTDAAAWFVHTVPNFLAHLGGYSWPAAETAKGHMFLCVSFVEAHLNTVAKAIRYQEPYIYANNLPAALLSQHIELSNLATGVEIRITPFLEHAKFTTKSNQIDMYVKILRKKLSASIRIWAPSDSRSKSICNGQYRLRKIVSPMQFDGVQVHRENDNAKWALMEGKSTVCLTTNDYKITEKQIPGAAVCLENADVYSAFSAAAVNKYQKFMKMMFTAVIIVLISLKTSTAQVATCKNDVWADSATSIDNAQHSIGRTMAHFVVNNPQIKVLAYSDDPPNIPTRNQKSKTKGVLLIDMRADDAAAWFIHTAPNFLAYLSAYSWPAAETAKGHMFLCLSLNEIHLNSVAKTIRYQEPNIYANNLPADILNQHKELSNLVNGVEIRVTPFLEHAKFVTKQTQVGANIQAFGKHTKSFADMYAKVLRNKLSASIRIWAPSDVRSKSICSGQHKLRKIVSPMQFAGGQVHREADSAKWALVEGKNTICFTTNDYKNTEKKIPGAAVCLENAGVYNAFLTGAFNFIQMMLTATIIILVSLKSCIAQVATCKDDANTDTDWTKSSMGYFVYKPPNDLNTKIMKSEVNPRWSNSAASIDVTPGQSIARTMLHFVQNNPQIKVLAYNDDPPNIPARNRKSKAKGVLLIDKRRNDAAAWFVHTVPNFLAHLGGYSWPPTETAKGHIFLCLSFREEFLNSVGKAIRYQEPYIYANNLPANILNQHEELSNLVNGVEIRVTPFLENAKFVTKSAQVQANIQAFGKHSKSFADIYGRVLRNKLSANIRIWAPSDARSKSICKGQYKLRKIASPMQFADSEVSREADSTRWALVEGKNTVCLTTNDYKNSEKKVPGAAVCLENANVYNAFSQAASNISYICQF